MENVHIERGAGVSGSESDRSNGERALRAFRAMARAHRENPPFQIDVEVFAKIFLCFGPEGDRARK
jgi:hypothetical protein